MNPKKTVQILKSHSLQPASAQPEQANRIFFVKLMNLLSVYKPNLSCSQSDFTSIINKENYKTEFKSIVTNDYM